MNGATAWAMIATGAALVIIGLIMMRNKKKRGK